MRLNTYLSFDGDCKAAFKFYQKYLGGEIMAMTYGESPARDQVSAASHDKVMHACLVAGDQMLMGSDATPEYPYEGVKGVHVALHVDTPEEAEELFRGLSKGGKVTMPLGETFWAASFGMFVDQFGVPWMINCAKPE